MEFKITGEYIELAQLLKAAGLAESGGQAKLAVLNGEVRVDGAVEQRRGCKIRPGQLVEWNGQAVTVR